MVGTLLPTVKGMCGKPQLRPASGSFNLRGRDQSSYARFVLNPSLINSVTRPWPFCDLAPSWRSFFMGRGGTDTTEMPQAATWVLSFAPATPAYGIATTTQYSPNPAFTPATGRQLLPTTLYQRPPPPLPSPGGATVGVSPATFEAWATSVEDYSNICGWVPPVAAPYVRLLCTAEAVTRHMLPHNPAGPTSLRPTGQGKHRQEVSRRGHKRCTACGD
ncbi:hypothetical protein E2C01_047666 [Portunus trituberculatus]|uniref:Uncharacterized protein n=1 Tax=Portunus trituberculatus TaxID=210409 RepID=A0A5B7G875_PORTR|nr:hypothetical protein [Portunus trituberculatus]